MDLIGWEQLNKQKIPYPVLAGILHPDMRYARGSEQIKDTYYPLAYEFSNNDNHFKSLNDFFIKNMHVKNSDILAVIDMNDKPEDKKKKRMFAKPEYPLYSVLVNQLSFSQAISIKLFPSKTQEINMVQIVENKKQRLIRLPEVIRRTEFGKTWIYTLIKAGRFPSQIRAELRSTDFIESEVDVWINEIISDSRPASE